MSIYFVADGNYFSSKSYSGIQLQLSMTPIGRIHRDNADVIEGDSGVAVQYEKGTYRRIFPIRLPIITDQQRANMEKFWKQMSGRSNWFTIVLGDPPDRHYSAQFAQEGSASQTVIVNLTAFSDSQQPTHDNLVGAYIYSISGANAGKIRKITSQPSHGESVTVEAFPSNIETGHILRLGYPVYGESDSLEVIPRLPLYFDVNMRLIERIPNE